MTKEDEVKVVIKSIKMSKQSRSMLRMKKTRVITTYKTMEKKVQPTTTPLPKDNEKVMKGVSGKPILWDMKKVGHKFMEETIKELRI